VKGCVLFEVRADDKYYFNELRLQGVKRFHLNIVRGCRNYVIDGSNIYIYIGLRALPNVLSAIPL
jgi:hypothetical protein